jgi:uncharacterized protein
MYETGRGVQQDNAEAFRWYSRAAEQGYSKAQWTLGIMYVNGSGVPQDYVQAHAWFNRAARSASDADDRDRAVKSLDSMTARMTPAQIVQAQRLARD